MQLILISISNYKKAGNKNSALSQLRKKKKNQSKISKKDNLKLHEYKKLVSSNLVWKMKKKMQMMISIFWLVLKTIC
jgi:hypothetical protein